MYDVLVLGAGPAGVAAAQRAAGAGRRVAVLERGQRVGGLAGSFEVAGVRVDFGSHRLHPSIDPRILAELQRLLGDGLQLRRRNGRIRLGNRWIAFPLRAHDLVRTLPPSFALGAARDALLAPTRRARADTFAEVLRAGLGPTLCERFYFPYARKLWGLEPDEIAGEQARRRVAASSAGRIVGRLVGRPGERSRGSFWYPRTGYGTLWERLAEDAAAAGAEIRLGATMERIELEDGRVRAVVAGGAALEGGVLFTTAPLGAVATMVSPAPPRDVLAAASALEFRAMTIVYLVVAGPRYTPYDAHYLPEAFTPVTRVSEPKNYRDGDDPHDRTVLCAEIPCAVGDPVWRASDGELAELVLDTLRAAGLPPADVRALEVRRLPRVYPVYRVGYERALERLERWAATAPPLLSFGRLGLFVHDNAHHALAMGWAAAYALRPDGGVDRDAWDAARAQFARHVVED